LFHPHLRPPVPGFEEPCPGLERERLVRRLFAWLIPLLAVAACTAGGGLTGPAGHGEMVYRDSAGWTVDVPAGWHVLRFGVRIAASLQRVFSFPRPASRTLGPPRISDPGQ
jgi:hypothetical protein